MLGPGGAVARAMGPGYEPRPEQVAMGEAVDRALASRGHLLVEAGTGVGKSFAYLVPAIRRCVEHGEVVVVATNTIALQEQLVEKDIPLLESVFAGAGHPLRAVLVKGRGNYLSIRRLKLASARQDRLFADADSRRALHQIEDWAYETRDGTLSTLPQLERGAVWDRVRSDSGNCMGRRCPHHDACFYQSARRAMEGANLLICNHALFFSDLALRMREVGFLPEHHHVILDEAHAAEDVAAEHFGISVSEGRVSHLLNMLYHPRTGRGYLGQLQVSEDAGVERAVQLVLAADGARRAFFESLIGYSQRERNGRIHGPDVVENVLTPAMNELALRLRGLKDRAVQEADRYELNSYAERASEIADAAEALVSQTSVGCVYWVEVSRIPGSGRPARVTLACSPVEVASLLREHLFGAERSVVMTSATLATRAVHEDEPAEHAETAFAHVMTRLGCEGAATLQLGSPFDYARQVEVFIDRSMPRPGGGLRRKPPHPTRSKTSEPPSPRGGEGAESYEDALARRVLDHVIATEGGAFVLFTSFATLNALSDRLREPLGELGYPLLAQGRDGPRGEILRRFREDNRAVLFGASSFWQGVDVRGHGLRNVIITRLPFDPPDRPLTEARLERIAEQGGDPFMQDSVPRAVIRFKQGFGRLIRSAGDHGRVVVLDPRIVTTGYGKRFRAASPDGVEPTVL